MEFKNLSDKLYKKFIPGEKEGEYYRRKRVYPYLNKDGTINWFNFLTGGSWLKLAITIGIVLLIIGSLYEWGTTLQNYGNLVSMVGDSPCKYLIEVGNKFHQINLSNLTLP